MDTLKIPLLTSLLLLTALVGRGQPTEWFPVGATWYYGYYNNCVARFIKLKAEKDTLILGKSCRELGYYQFTRDRCMEASEVDSVKLQNLFMYTSGDTAWVYVPVVDSFVVNYAWGPAPTTCFNVSSRYDFFTNEWEVHAGTQRMCITHSGDTTLNGAAFQYYAYDSWFNSRPSTTIIEYIGNLNSPVWQPEIADAGGVYNLRCFDDGQGFSYQFSYNGYPEDCRAIVYSDVSRDAYAAATKLYYNARDYLLSVEARLNTTTIYDALGRTIRTTTNRTQISVEDLLPGIYYVVATANGRHTTLKIYRP